MNTCKQRHSLPTMNGNENLIHAPNLQCHCEEDPICTPKLKRHCHVDRPHVITDAADDCASYPAFDDDVMMVDVEEDSRQNPNGDGGHITIIIDGSGVCDDSLNPSAQAPRRSLRIESLKKHDATNASESDPDNSDNKAQNALRHTGKCDKRKENKKCDTSSWR